MPNRALGSKGTTSQKGGDMKAKAISIIVTLALVISLISVLAPPSASPVRAASTWYVNPGERIQAAVDAAIPGDTIIVRDGTYIENVSVNKEGLTLVSLNGPSATIIEALTTEINHGVIGVAADHVRISGFTVQNCTSGTGIGIGLAAGCTIENNIVLNNTYGILLSYGHANTISKNTVRNNTGYNILIQTSSNNTITGNTINATISSNSPGICLSYSANGNTVSGNTITNLLDGIAMYVSCDNNTITENHISDCYSSIRLQEACTGNTITLNTLTNSPWGVNLWNSSNNTIYLNNSFSSGAYSDSANTWHSPTPITYSYNGTTYTGYLGNYWSDYAGGGGGGTGDGVGDTPYALGADQDNYPLMQPFEDYVLDNLAVSESWVARLNGPADFSDCAYEIAVDSAGNVYVIGTLSGGATVKYDVLGEIVWIVYSPYGGVSHLLLDSEDNVYVTGVYEEGLSTPTYTVKYTPEGEEAWVRRFGTWPCVQTALDGDGDIYVLTTKQLLKYDSYGNELWNLWCYDPNGAGGFAKDIDVDAQGNAYVTGQYGADYATTKYDPSGNLLWMRSFNGAGGFADIPVAITVDTAGNSYVTGSSESYQYGYTDILTVKYDTNGDLLWDTYYGRPYDCDGGADIRVDGEGQVYVVGSGFTLKYGPDGSLLWVREGLGGFVFYGSLLALV